MSFLLSAHQHNLRTQNMCLYSTHRDFSNIQRTALFISMDILLSKQIMDIIQQCTYIIQYVLYIIQYGYYLIVWICAYYQVPYHTTLLIGVGGRVVSGDVSYLQGCGFESRQLPGFLVRKKVSFCARIELILTNINIQF